MIHLEKIRQQNKDVPASHLKLGQLQIHFCWGVAEAESNVDDLMILHQMTTLPGQWWSEWLPLADQARLPQQKILEPAVCVSISSLKNLYDPQ